MATSKEYADFVCEQVTGLGAVRSKKMFGEYMVYIDDKPILLVCYNTVFIKMLDCVADLMDNAETGAPYDGAKPHYILDIENRELTEEAVKRLLEVTPIPKPRKKKVKE